MCSPDKGVRGRIHIYAEDGRDVDRQPLANTHVGGISAHVAPFLSP